MASQQTYTLDELMEPSVDWNSLDYFTLFGISQQEEDLKVIKKAYMSRIKATHPDRMPADSPEKQLAVDRTAVLNAAWNALSDPIKRASYRVSLTLDFSAENSEEIVPVFRACEPPQAARTDEARLAGLRDLMKQKLNTPFIRRMDTVHWEAPVPGVVRYLAAGATGSVPASARLTAVVGGEPVTTDIHTVAYYTLWEALPLADDAFVAFPGAQAAGFRAGAGPSQAMIEDAAAEAQRSGKVNARGLFAKTSTLAVPGFVARASGKKQARRDQLFEDKLTKRISRLAPPEGWDSRLALGVGVPLVDMGSRRADAGAPLGHVSLASLKFAEDGFARDYMRMISILTAVDAAVRRALVQRFVDEHAGAPTDPEQYKFENVDVSAANVDAGPSIHMVIEAPAELVVYEYGISGARHWMLRDLATGAVEGYAPRSGAKVAAKVAGGVLAAPFVLAGAAVGAGVYGASKLIKKSGKKKNESE